MLCKNFEFGINLKLLLPYNLAILLLVIYSRGRKTYVHTKLYTEMVIIDLFIRPPNLSQLKCSSTDECINIFYVQSSSTDECINIFSYVQTMKYYSAIKRNKLLRYVTM